jgi:hypothetical protein
VRGLRYQSAAPRPTAYTLLFRFVCWHRVAVWPIPMARRGRVHSLDSAQRRSVRSRLGPGGGAALGRPGQAGWTVQPLPPAVHFKSRRVSDDASNLRRRGGYTCSAGGHSTLRTLTLHAHRPHSSASRAHTAGNQYIIIYQRGWGGTRRGRVHRCSVRPFVGWNSCERFTPGPRSTLSPAAVRGVSDHARPRAGSPGQLCRVPRPELQLRAARGRVTV